MRDTIRDDILCPCCYGGLEIEESERRYGMAWEGRMRCRSCAAEYPLKGGIAFLSAIDRTWRPMLGEFLARVEITEAVKKDGGFEADRQESVEVEYEVTRDLMGRMLERALEELRVQPGMRVLDVGADMCGVARRFVALGAEVVALDVEYTHLQSVDFGADEGAATPGTFTRVMGDAHRLPFADGSFDVAFCRSSIHHLDNMHVALKEMARVTAPGGRVFLASEPARAVLDSEALQVASLFDYQQGLNERMKPVYYMTLPLRLFGRDLQVEYHDPIRQMRTQRLFDIARVKPESLFRSGEKLGFVSSFKLLLTTAATNVSVIRNRLPAPRPAALGPSDLVCDVDDLVTTDIVYKLSPELIDGRDPVIAYLELHRERLGEVYSGLIADERPPAGLDMWRPGSEGFLRTGFRDVERWGHGPGFRRTNRRAYCYLGALPAAGELRMRVRGFSPGGGPSKGTVLVNRVPAGEFDVPGIGRRVLVFRKPQAAAGGGVLEIEVRNSTMCVGDSVLANGDTREVGLGVESIWQGE